MVCALGSAIGTAAGAWMGAGMLGSYRPFFRFPEMPYLLPAWLPLLGTGASLAAAFLGVLAALRRTLRLPPAEGLRWGRRVSAGCVERGVLVRPLGDVIVLVPPLTTTAGEVDAIVDAVAASLADVCD